jgi:cytochrome c556
MQRLPILIAAVAALAAPAFAQEDPIAARQALMRNNSAAAGVANAIMNDEIEYSPAVGRAAIAAWSATAHTITAFFPEGSADETRSRALPKIWEDLPAFLEAVEAFQTDVAAAVEASGREGPPDKETFVAAAQPVLENCGACHEAWRRPSN